MCLTRPRLLAAALALAAVTTACRGTPPPEASGSPAPSPTPTATTSPTPSASLSASPTATPTATTRPTPRPSATLAPRDADGADPRRAQLALAPFIRGLDSPVFVTSARDGTGRLFIVERSGRIKVHRGRAVSRTLFLDIRSRVKAEGEGGLLGLAFGPAFARSGQLFVTYSDREGDLRVSRFTARRGAATVDPRTELVLLDIRRRETNVHYGGHIAFGPDGFLYVSTGDGGRVGDPAGNAQNRNGLLGKVLRLDVTRRCGSTPYCIPADNPFVGRAGHRAEVWHLGLRNPYRFGFAPAGGMYIGDVGEQQREEVDAVGHAPHNLGWPCREGTAVTPFAGPRCAGVSSTPPVFEYPHDSGCAAVVAGLRYAGKQHARLLGGVFVFADFCTNRLYGLSHRGSRWVGTRMGTAPAGTGPAAFGADAEGELLLVGVVSGTVYRVAAAPR